MGSECVQALLSARFSFPPRPRHPPSELIPFCPGDRKLEPNISSF